MTTLLDIELLKRQRAAFKGQLTQFKGKIAASASVGSFESLLRRIQLIYDKYDAVQCQLELVDESSSTDRLAFEDDYGLLESTLRDKLHDIKRTEDSTLSTSVLNTSHHELNSGASGTVGVRLPEIILPSFNGLESNWLAFRDVYVDLIHDKQLEPTVKFLYLISSIRSGSAFRLIESLPVTSNSYELAWKTLCDRYNNETNIQRFHVKELYDARSPDEDSSRSLETFVDTILKNYNALQSLKINVSSWDLLLVHHITQKLDNGSRLYVLKNSKLNSTLSFVEMIQLLRNRIRILQAMSLAKPLSGGRNPRSQRRSVLNSSMVPPSIVSNGVCGYCRGAHTLVQCPVFTSNKLSPRLRFHFVKEKRICGNCLLGQHFVSECNQPPCSKCALKHHALLHFPPPTPNAPWNNSHPVSEGQVVIESSSGVPTDLNIEESPNEATCSGTAMASTPSLQSSDKPKSIILLGTARVQVSVGNRTQICRVLLDSGSSMNFVTSQTCHLLNVHKCKTNKIISGIGASESTLTHKTYLTISSLVSDFNVTLKFYVIPRITGQLPSTPLAMSTFHLPHGVQLADPFFTTPGRIDLLLGAEMYHQLFTGATLIIDQQLPPLQETKLGYIICGKSTPSNHSSGKQQARMALCNVESLESQIKLFWELESLPIKPIWSHDATMCEEHYQSNVTRLENGRYVVALPTKSNITELGHSRFSAQRQFLALEKRLNNNEDTYLQYRTFMEEYRALGHMTLSTSLSASSVFYLPHHCVFKEQSTTTKLRVVFNGSAKTSSHLSLNDCLLVGPTIQQDLVSILLRFRIHNVAFIGDIAKMYRQIFVRTDQTDFQRILWRNHPSEPIQSYNLQTITYGTACAPFLATRTLKQLAIDECCSYPSAAHTLQNDFYVDDVLTGSDSVDSAQKLKSDLINLLSRGGFELRKFFSNAHQLASDEQSNSSIVLLLGLLWNTGMDTFETPLDKLPLSSTCTKRVILSEICQLFDPLGTCSPIIVTAKLLMQMIWTHHTIRWDDDLPLTIIQLWNLFKEEVHLLHHISVPRHVLPLSQRNIQLHGFCDASEKAYGCVIYVRSLTSSNQIMVSLLCAKSRVAPLKKETIPRLELCAAVLLAELVTKILPVIGIKFDSVHLWTDSTITLFRIQSEPHKYTAFVANRLTKIQELTDSDSWRYVNTKENPADIVSRGLMPSQFKSASLWWNGPEFLKIDSSLWSSISPACGPLLTDLERRLISTAMVTQSMQLDEDIFCRFQSLTKLIRVVAYIFRFFNNARHLEIRNASRSMHLHPKETQGAITCLIKLVQLKVYSADIQALQKTKQVSTKSSLLPLAVILDDLGVLRVGGRLSNASIANDHKHPILLPKHHMLSLLLVRHEHLRLLHAGPQALLCNLRLTYWIIGGRDLCRSVVLDCIRCSRAKPCLRNQIMGDLPIDRVTRSDRAFTNAGIDFCGPFLLQQSVRSKIRVKCYICWFVCFATKAVHLEMVLDTTTEAFIACLRRFVSRRGICSRIYSDNATNFIGARTQLQELRKLFTSTSFQETTHHFCTDQHIEWKTIPPRSLHFGGLWEAAVKRTKHHLIRVIGVSSLNIEQFLTLTVQIEACLNSRPLTPMSSDPSDLQPLTPGHFLIGAPLTALPESSFLDTASNRLSKFQRTQQLMQSFWDRWHLEYLSELQTRQKWNKGICKFEIGQLVILHDDNAPPMKWHMGRIIAVHPGSDGVIRVVTVKTALSELKRAVNKISVLPIDNAN